MKTFLDAEFRQHPLTSRESTKVARADHFTLQHLKEPTRYNLAAAAALAATGNSHYPFTLFASGLHMDALLRDTGSSLPPAVIPDYVYDVAAYNRWSSRQGDVHGVVENYYREHYKHIPVPPRRPPSDDGDYPPSEEPDDLPPHHHSGDVIRPQGGGT